MKKLGALIGIGILGVLLISSKTTQFCSDNETNLSEVEHNPFAEGLRIEMESANLDASSIIVLEEEEEVDLGFDTSEYLPLGFNAYEGMELDPKDIVVLEEEEEIVLNFNVAQYLPENFDAYAK